MKAKSIMLASWLVGHAAMVILAEAPNPDIGSLELSMAARIESIVKDIGGVSKAWVWVKIDPDLDRWRAFVKTLYPAGKKTRQSVAPAAIPRATDILPGVNPDEMAGMLQRKESALGRPASPRSKSPDFENAVTMATWFQRVSIRVAVPDSIAPERLEDLKHKLPILIGLHAEQGDTLAIETFPETKDAPQPLTPKGFWVEIRHWAAQISPNMAMLWAFLFALLMFFFGPIRKFLQDAAVALQSIRVQTQTSSSIETRLQEAEDAEIKSLPAEEDVGARHAVPLLETNSEGSKDIFGFITDEMLPNVIQICREETPEHVAMLVNYLKPAQATQIVSSMPLEKRQWILSHFTHESQFDPQEVRAFAERLKNSIHFVSGGPDRLLQLIEESEPAARQALMEELDQLFPDTSRAIRARLLTPADVFQIERKDLQKLLWEAYRTKIALPVLFAMVSPKGQEYLIHQLPDSIADILRQEIRAVSPVAADKAETEGRKLLQLARFMAKSGDIAPIVRKVNPGAAA